MENTKKTIKIKHGNEVRVLKDINSFHQLVETISNKMKINSMDNNYELAYKDEEGEKIHLSTSDDFSEYLRFNGKLPKIELRRLDSDLENNPVYQNIQLTVSTVERPPKREEDGELNLSFDDPDESLFEKLDEKYTEESGIQASVDFTDKD